MEETTTETSPNEVPIIEFDYLKSPGFRTIHVDGAWGGITPQLGIYMCLYNMRPAVPEHVAHYVKKTGDLGGEIAESRRGRTAIVREVEFGMHMSIDVAKGIRQWLDEKITVMQDLMTGQTSEQPN